MENKVEAIKTANNLKSDVLKIGQKLTLGLSKDRVADWNVAKEDGVEKRDGESLAAALAIVAAGKIAADTASVAATTKTGQIMMTAAKELTKKAINWALANPIKTFVGGKIIKGAIDPNPATDPLEATGAVTRKGLEKGAEKIEKLINNSDETKRK